MSAKIPYTLDANIFTYLRKENNKANIFTYLQKENNKLNAKYCFVIRYLDMDAKMLYVP